MTKDEREHLSKVAALGCIICKRLGHPGSPAEIHHCRTGVGAGRRADHYHAIPLCPPHHRGNDGIHGMGRKRFEREYGITELELLEQVRGMI